MWVAGLLLIFIWPLAARSHLRLYKHGVYANRSIRRWFKMRSDSIPWAEMRDEQQALGSVIDSFGRSLVLPGDADWVEPGTGMDDYEMVRVRDSDESE